MDPPRPGRGGVRGTRPVGPGRPHRVVRATACSAAEDEARSFSQRRDLGRGRAATSPSTTRTEPGPRSDARRRRRPRSAPPAPRSPTPWCLPPGPTSCCARRSSSRWTRRQRSTVTSSGQPGTEFVSTPLSAATWSSPRDPRPRRDRAWTSTRRPPRAPSGTRSPTTPAGTSYGRTAGPAAHHHPAVLRSRQRWTPSRVVHVELHDLSAPDRRLGLLQSRRAVAAELCDGRADRPVQPRRRDLVRSPPT